MNRRAKFVLAAAAGGAFIILAWGYWHSVTHAYLHLRVDDYALSSSHVTYGAPHNVSVTLRDRSNRVLADARSVEPMGYILAVHPDAAIGNCEHRGRIASSTQESQREYSACYKQYSAWSATWAPAVHSADVKVGSCELRGVPVAVRTSNTEWLLWWVPLPHVGGLPRQYFNFSVAIDSRVCAPVSQQLQAVGSGAAAIVSPPTRTESACPDDARVEPSWCRGLQNRIDCDGAGAGHSDGGSSSRGTRRGVLPCRVADGRSLTM